MNLVETDQLWGHRNDPVNFHRCLQDFDRRLTDILDALRPGDLLVMTSDHGCDPTTPGTDHNREHALLLAYAEGRNANGRSTKAGVLGRRGDRQRVARRQGTRSRDPRTLDLRRVTSIRPAELIERKRDGGELSADEMRDLILGYGSGDVPDYQMAAFCMAVFSAG